MLFPVTSGLLSVLPAVAVNVATGGVLPGPLAAVSWLAWPALGLLGTVSVLSVIWRQRIAEADGAGSVDGAARTRPAELPAPGAAFAGRAEDLTAVGRILDSGCRVLVVVGPPGVGKSSLALRVAHDRRTRFADGQLFAVLRGAHPGPVQPETVLQRFLDALGVPDDERRGSAEDLAARFRTAVAHRKLLLLPDDARDAAQVRPLLPGGAGRVVLVTSRRFIAELSGATVHPLGGLDEAERMALLAAAAGAERMALLAAAAGAQRVDADLEAAARIVRLCGGLPPAVRIAWSRLRARPAWTVADLAERLADGRRRLDELRLGDAAVRSNFAAFYRELSTVDQVVFRRAGSHAGRFFTAGAAAALAGMVQLAAVAALERLVDTHLVETPAPDRYWLHDLLRLFATVRRAADERPEDRDACLTRLLHWYTRHADRGERDNIVAAVRPCG